MYKTRLEAIEPKLSTDVIETKVAEAKLLVKESIIKCERELLRLETSQRQEQSSPSYSPEKLYGLQNQIFMEQDKKEFFEKVLTDEFEA